MSEKVRTVDFGAPQKFGAHVFRVEIPAARNETVHIVEDYGYRGQEGGIPRDEERVVLPRAVWSGIADIARHEFNERLENRQGHDRSLALRYQPRGSSSWKRIMRARLGG